MRAVTTTSVVDELAGIERRRLRSLVDVRVEEADGLHAPDFRIVNPRGWVWTKEQYLGGIADGSIDYHRFDVVSDLEVSVDGDLAVLRYRSAIEITVAGHGPSTMQCWHLDCYRRESAGSPWRARWSQATEILPGPPPPPALG